MLVKALAIKKGMFPSFQDYDPYAFYAANRLFFALRKNQLNQGKTIKGKVIRPIKSCLNYTKALMYPMKIEYQREAYREIIDEEHASKQFDAFAFQEQMRDDAAQDQANSGVLRAYLLDTFENAGKILDTVLDKLPFHKNTQEYKRIRISVLLNCNQSLKTKGKMTIDNSQTIILWKLPKSMAGYIKVLIREYCAELSKEISDCYAATRMDDDTLDKIINYKEGADYEYEDQY